MKHYKNIITLFALLLALPAALHAAEPAKPPAKPNIVLVLIDDFGYEYVTANGGESYKTPVMDSSPQPACVLSSAMCSRSARPRGWS